MKKVIIYSLTILFNFILLKCIHMSTASCVTTDASTVTNAEAVSCVGYSVICDNVSTIEDIRNSLDTQFGKWYLPLMWKHYCINHFSCNFNQESIAVINELFNKASGLDENIPLDLLATLASYDIELNICNSSLMPLVFKAYKYFEGKKEFSLSFVNCNISEFNLIHLVTIDNSTYAPIAYYRAPMLNQLNLTGNFIFTISSKLNNSTHFQCTFKSVIKVLDLSYNRITAEESLFALCCIADLRALHLRFNRVNKVSSLIVSCLETSLISLDLANNNIKTLKDFVLYGLKNLKHLDGC